MKPFNYTITRIGVAGAFRINLNWRGNLFPIPGRIYYSEEVARLTVADMEREDAEALARREKNPNIEYDAHGKPL